MSNKEVETVAPPSVIQPDQNSGPVHPTNVVDKVISDDTIESAATNASKVQSNDKKVRWFLSIWKKSLPPKKAKSNDVVDALTPTGTVLTSGGINTKKATANGLMDFAFLTANANQLNQAINNWPNKNRTLIIVLISISIGLQILAGVLLIVTSYIQSQPPDDVTTDANSADSAKQKARTRRLILIDHLTIALVFFIAVVNLFIAAFSSNSSNNDTQSTQ